MNNAPSIFTQLGLRHVVNAIGFATPLGNARQDEEVIEAMAQACRSFISIAHLQQIAGRRIAALTHAESGYVVSGAAAGLTLATAACMAGLDPMRMNMLPQTSAGTPNRVVVHRMHRYDYDHAVRQAGAELDEVGFPNLTFPYELQAAIGPDTAAVLFRGDGSRNVVPFEEVVQIAHSKNVPVIVDAALTVPPPENLWAFTDAGADLVVFSGGKAIGGPPASGFVAGRADLVASIALQHQDMDVRLETWTSAPLGSDAISDPPYQGIGRPMKIGKEQIVGLLVALDRYSERDHESDLEVWLSRVERIRDGILSHITNLNMVIEHDPKGNTYVPQLRIDFDSKAIAVEVARALRRRDPAVYCNEGALWDGSLVVVPSCIRPDEEAILIDALTAEIGAVNPSSTRKIDGRSQ